MNSTETAVKESLDPAYQHIVIQNQSSIAKVALLWVKDFLYWWYLKMPVFHLLTLRRIIIVLNDQLSFSLLISTFFIPWKRDRRATGYFVGIVVRLIYLPIAFSAILISVILYIAFIIFWVTLPIITVILLIATPFLPI